MGFASGVAAQRGAVLVSLYAPSHAQVGLIGKAHECRHFTRLLLRCAALQWARYSRLRRIHSLMHAIRGNVPLFDA